MSNIDKKWLRQLAVDAKELAIIKRYTKGIEAQKKFIAAMTPALVLALLDEMEAKDNRAVEMPTFDGYVPHIARELQAAFRIACDNAGINVSAGTDEGDRA
ncbi:ead/Ea22-like family protein [Escherichia coli]|uniref:ead/Ea22-like family protein n=1 Tax=Escherichia coli TaxID=562 RepID=UPI00222811EE|nr:ead/Ea22-like family protein [Escherichia coli]MCW3298067.1 ead/Ea22-like family protein [Escherichia coli]